MRDLESKVVIDSNIDQNTPTVFVSDAPREDRQEEHKSKENLSLPALIVKKVTTFVLDFLETIVVALSIFVVVYLFLVQPHEVKGSSMEPNFHNNEYILTDKISFRLHEPQRGDVVIFKAPKNPEVDYIKRVIALPGDRVKVQGGFVYINDEKLDEPYLADQTNLFPGSFLSEGVDITVSEEEYFVLGDNRPHSSDSREFGPIPKKLMIGRAFLRYWPPGVAGLLPVIRYSL